MSSRSKRSRQEAGLEDTDSQGHIRLADGSSLPADLLELRVLSSCARGLPADAQQWDLSGLLVDGAPVSRHTVEAWLACVGSSLDGRPLDDSSKAQLETATGLHHLLVFADAVGSRTGVVNACLSQLHDLELVVQLGSRTLGLSMDQGAGGYYIDDEYQLWYATLKSETSIGDPLTSQEQADEFRREAAKQTEALLHIAHVLQLPQLLQVVHGFIFRNHELEDGVLREQLPSVFSDRVLAAAVGGSSSRMVRDAYVTSVLTQPCSAHNDAGVHQLLRASRNAAYAEDEDELRWTAQLTEDFFGCKAGDELAVQLDLLSPFGPSIRFGEDGPWLRVQLLLGKGLWGARDRRAYLGDKS